MKTQEEMIAEIEAGLRGIRDIEKHAWERYDATGDNNFLSILTHMGKARVQFVFTKQLLATVKNEGEKNA